MPSKSPNTALRDFLHHIDLVAQFVGGLDFQRFRNDARTLYAVTRCLEIISEASRRLPEALKHRHPSIAWRDMAGQVMFIGTITKMLPPDTFGTPLRIICRRCGWLFSKSFAQARLTPVTTRNELRGKGGADEIADLAL